MNTICAKSGQFMEAVYYKGLIYKHQHHGIFFVARNGLYDS